MQLTAIEHEKLTVHIFTTNKSSSTTCSLDKLCRLAEMEDDIRILCLRALGEMTSSVISTASGSGAGKENL